MDEDNVLAAKGQKKDPIVDFVCQFCGNRWKEESPFEDDKKIEVPACRRCFPKLRRGEQIRYGAPERAPADAVYADQHLKRDEVYTVEKVRQWQHGSYVYLRETGNKEFNSRLFTPKDFRSTLMILDDVDERDDTQAFRNQ